MTELTIRAALGTESHAITQLAMQSKAHWGYPPEVLELRRDELIFTPEQCASGTTFVAAQDDRIVGFYETGGVCPRGELNALFVAPGHTGTEVGGLLLQHALIRATHDGFRELWLDADPHAVDFYRRHGARVVGVAPSRLVPGRALARMRFELGDLGAAGLRERWMTAADQRGALLGIADLIERHYVFADVASLCARELRERPVIEEGLSTIEFSQQLTQELRIHDRHFAVTWGAPMDLPLRSAAESDDTSIDFRREGEVGILTIRLFEDVHDVRAAKQVAEALTALSNCEAAVVDVTSNPGGWPSMVEFVLGPFLGPDPVKIVTFKSADEPDVASWSRPQPNLATLGRMPLIAVTGRHTASAAESFAYALKTTKRATLVGEPTAGAANPVESFLDSSGFAVYISTGAPIDPRTNANWDQTGVRPDIGIGTDQALDLAIGIARAANR